MITHRIAAGSMLIAESSDMSSAPSAARSTGIRQVYVPVAPGRAPRGGRLRLLSALVGATGPIISPFFLGYGLRRGAYVAHRRPLPGGRLRDAARRLPALRPAHASHRDDRGRVARAPPARPIERGGPRPGHRGAPGELRGPLPPLPGSLAGDVARHPPLTWRGRSE